MTLLPVMLAALLASSAPEPPPMPEPAGCADYMRPGTPVDACDEAIAAATDAKDKSVLLYRRAYIKIGRGEYLAYAGAVADLDEAIALFPGNWRALHERAYLFIELGEPAKAEADLDRQLAITPGEPAGLGERALARFYQANLEGALADRDELVRLNPGDLEHAAGKVRALLWLGRFDDARREARRMADLIAKSGRPGLEKALEAQSAEIEAWANAEPLDKARAVCRMPEPDSPPDPMPLFGNCTRVFLEAQDNAVRADALSIRSIVTAHYFRNPDAATEDLRIAYALDPADGRHALNLGMQLAELGRYGESLAYLDRGLKAKPIAHGYAMRAQARLAVGDCPGAGADAKTSVELEESMLAYLVMGDHAHFCQKDDKAAMAHWTKARDLGAPPDMIAERLNSLK